MSEKTFDPLTHNDKLHADKSLYWEAHYFLGLVVRVRDEQRERGSISGSRRIGQGAILYEKKL
ncbi:hypothetical protein ACFSL6_24385 [Paenibacillus thailandensis]|uniref:hypothetical protein n=1 Tax=Paenibacillus thailandensis TaxID=393250 RepID=UPI003638493D